MLAQTAFHRVFQLLSQMAHIRFRSRKRVHTRLCSKDRTQRITGRNRGCFRWGAITTLGAFRTFTNIPGPGIRTAYFAAFGSWSEALLKDTESLRNSDALMRVAVPQASRPRWAALPRLQFGGAAFFRSAFGTFCMCEARGGITTLGVLYMSSKRPMPACQSG